MPACIYNSQNLQEKIIFGINTVNLESRPEGVVQVMKKKIIKPGGIAGEMVVMLSTVTLGFGLPIVLALSYDKTMGFILFIFLFLLWCIFLGAGFIRHYKDHMEIDYGKVIIDQKVMELGNTGKKKKNSWIHQRIEINPADVSRIGFSFEMYGKDLYCHSEKTSQTKKIINYQGAYEEVAIEMNDGSIFTFDPLIYSLKQLREIINILSRNGEVQISTELEKVLK